MKRNSLLLLATLMLMCTHALTAGAQENGSVLLTASGAQGTVTPGTVELATRTDMPVKAEISITNTGTVAFNTTIAFFSNYGYFVFDDDNDRSDIAPGQVMKWHVTYCPATAGTHTAQLNVNIGGTLHYVSFSGTAYGRGDTNNDGRVDISDLTALISYLMNADGAVASLPAADTNGDGEVTVTDVTTLIAYLLEDAWPVVEEPVEPEDPVEPETETFTVGGVTFKMVAVKGGTFTMGSDDSYASAKPAHQVTLSSYCIGETEVTQALWLAVMGSNPSYFKGNLQRPVENVTWYGCQSFISRLNELTGRTFRLPTEAEWEFAARGGNESQGYIYAGSDTLDDVAWYDYNSWDQDDGHGSHPVATKAPNELGLYDMNGNITEWVQDWLGSYSSEAQVNPTGASTGVMRVGRGGNWSEMSCSVVGRGASNPSECWFHYGLRLAL